jgi:hypothetical protein
MDHIAPIADGCPRSVPPENSAPVLDGDDDLFYESAVGPEKSATLLNHDDLPVYASTAEAVKVRSRDALSADSASGPEETRVEMEHLDESDGPRR